MEIEEDKLCKDNIDDDKINPYHNIIVNNIDRENLITSQMKQWLILSNVVDYYSMIGTLKIFMI